MERYGLVLAGSVFAGQYLAGGPTVYICTYSHTSMCDVDWTRLYTPCHDEHVKLTFSRVFHQGKGSGQDQPRHRRTNSGRVIVTLGLLNRQPPLISGNKKWRIRMMWTLTPS